MPSYLAGRIIDRSPFEVIDVPGVGELVKIGAERCREANAALKLGICGEHGGDPGSIRFFDSIRLDYVSCSPYRAPVARVAAAQAAIHHRSSGDRVWLAAVAPKLTCPGLLSGPANRQPGPHAVSAGRVAVVPAEVPS
jgi:PEP-utilising enzyme, PEP-binding domain